jgi:uncharacterized protein
MKVTVDTNVLISATFWSGSSEKVIMLAQEKKIELILSKAILEEYAKVLEYEEIKENVKNNDPELRFAIEQIISMSKIVETTESLQIVKEDPDDNKILECAKAGEVDNIISRDKHLLKLNRFENIPIITPEEFLKKI